MPFIIKTLDAKRITLPSLADAYTVPSNRTSFVTSLRIVNSATSSTSINLYAKPNGGTARRIIQKDLVMAPGAMTLIEDLVSLAAGDKIQILSSAPTTDIDCTTFGVERD